MLAVLVVIRAALPLVLRHVLASRASQALRARVEIGDVDLALLRCGIALTDVTIRSAASQEAGSDDRPLIAWKRFAVAVRWLPLFQKTVRLREVVLESPRVALDRLDDGRWNLLALVPEQHTAPTPETTPPPSAARGAAAPATEGNGWGFGADRITLRDGGLRFRDFKIKDSEPVEVNFDAVDVTDIALEPGIYGEPAHLHIAVAVDEGSAQLDARLTRQGEGIALSAELDARNLPLRRSRLYVPKVGWSALEGRLDAAVSYRLESGTQNELRGKVTLRDVVVRVSGVDAPAVAWRSFSAQLDPVDLVGHNVIVSDVELNGASILVRPQGGDLLPLLSAGANGPPPAESPSATPAGTPVQSTGTTARSGASAPPWHWSLASLRVADSHVQLIGAEEPIDVGVALGVSDLNPEGSQPARLQLALTVGKGSLNVDGAARLAPPGFGGTLRITDLSLPELAAATGVLPRGLLQAAQLGAQLTVEAGLAADGADGVAVAARDVRLRGALSLAGLRVASAGVQGFSLGARSIDLTIADLRAPGVLPASGTKTVEPGADAGELRTGGRLSLVDVELAGADPNAFVVGTRALDLTIKELSVPGVLPGGGADAAAQPLRVALGDLRITGPRVRITRTADGLVLPATSSAPAPPAAETPAPQASPARRVEVTLDTLRLAEGNVALADRAVKPFFEGRLSPLAIDVRGVRWPDLAVKDLHLRATSAEHGKIEIFGALGSNTGWLEVHADTVALPPFNPYATTFSGYSIGGGTLSITTKGSLSNGRYDVNNQLVLGNLDVRSAAGESLFQQTFGIPLSMALALMRDTHGDIALGIPVAADAEGVKVGLATVIREALQRAIMGAITSPLKLAGAVFGGGKVESIMPTAISFRTGCSELTPAGAEQLDQLAALLAGRPGLRVALDAKPATTDARWLREQALRVEWEGQGVFARLRDLPQRSTQKTIRAALEARAKDQEGKLGPEDAATLDRWLDERPPIPAAQLNALADSRLARVEQVLRDQHGIDAVRVTRRETPADTTDDTPAVHIELGAVGSP